MGMKNIVPALLLSLTGVRDITSDNTDWCSLSCGNDQNTMCKYEPQKNAGYCKNIEKATTKAARKQLLHVHNEYRNKISNGIIVSDGLTWPKASNMRQMSWDYDLEKLAYRWVQQCSHDPPHDKCRRTPMFKETGQNIGWSSATYSAPPAEDTFYGWVGEISKTKPDIVDQLPDVRGMLHFTQVIWGETFKLGCAAIHVDKDGLKATVLACNYGPGGNMIGGRVYQRGDPCSNCPAQTSCRNESVYPQLCALQTDDRKPADIDDPLEVSPPDNVTTGESPSDKEVTAKSLTDMAQTVQSPPKVNGSCKLKLFGMKPKHSTTRISLLSSLLTFFMLMLFK